MYACDGSVRVVYWHGAGPAFVPFIDFSISGIDLIYPNEIKIYPDPVFSFSFPFPVWTFRG